MKPTEQRNRLLPHEWVRMSGTQNSIINRTDFSLDAIRNLYMFLIKSFDATIPHAHTHLEYKSFVFIIWIQRL